MLFGSGPPFTSLRQNTLQLVEAKPRFIRLEDLSAGIMADLSAGTMAEVPPCGASGSFVTLLAVELLRQGFCRGEGDHPFGRNLQFFTSLRIATFPRVSLPDLKAPNTRPPHVVTA